MFGCFYINELENKMPVMTIENIAAAVGHCSGNFLRNQVPVSDKRSLTCRCNIFNCHPRHFIFPFRFPAG